MGTPADRPVSVADDVPAVVASDLTVIRGGHEVLHGLTFAIRPGSE